jgi:hypothetical protein
LRPDFGGIDLRSKDQTNHVKEKTKNEGNTQTKFIRQIGPKVEIGLYDYHNAAITHSINCDDQAKAKQLALELSGTKHSSCAKTIRYTKLQSHTWYGIVLLEDLSEEDKNIITIFINEHSNIPDQAFKLKVHSLYIDDPNRPTNHALIQEILLVVASSGGGHE